LRLRGDCKETWHHWLLITFHCMGLWIMSLLTAARGCSAICKTCASY
jgi:hypothetical protein